MNKRINRIINEVISAYIKESNEYNIDSYYRRYDELKDEIFYDFLYNNNPEMTKRIPWMLIHPNQIKRIWEEYIRSKTVRDIKGLEKIVAIMFNNTIKIDILSYLSGHTRYNPDEDLEEGFSGYIENYMIYNIERLIGDINDDLRHKLGGQRSNYDPNQLRLELDENTTHNAYRDNRYLNNIVIKKIDGSETYEAIYEIIYDALLDSFYYHYSVDKNGTDIMSDYGLEPLQKLLSELLKTDDYGEMVVIIDKMLNVVHARNDLASWFVNGGSSALSSISGYIGDEDAFNATSSISNEKKPRSHYR